MIVKEGYPFILGFLIIALGLRIAGSFLDYQLIVSLSIIPALLLLFCLNFFRNPKREIPNEDRTIVSPADGKIVRINSVQDPDIGSGNIISIFLNVFNVHVNRAPIDGTVKLVNYKKGKFLAAFNHSASDENEQTNIHLESSTGLIKLKQIAGLLARRIRCYIDDGSQLKKGEKFGFIMFGSRVDIILPEHIELKVKLGEKVKGGESIIGKYYEKKA